ncbi:MAG: HNH endonuclease signature motif containing protein [Candidatus Poribacteria bacterium]|nr:HNH endonuclease signature motif containing protein [Candidatus Poribacteria bacterium]
MSVSEPLRACVASRANERCEYCQYPQEFTTFSLPVDHIVPQAADGPTEPDNLAFACSQCNRYKSSHQKGTDPVTGADVRLFNPRIDDWTVHFLLNWETGKIEGRTPIGRVTVDTLRMNDARPIRARQNLIKIGAYEDFKNTVDS